ncbi:xanthine dehydrogenase accessory protein XdhC [Maritimibacter sp. UBA3975]|uniref:xanthine dehydrogenase accessory protein XdhC n=1 Tax=Maritimibacter sp. UBA3975 TaxID=1946833 RepID=UPI000C0B5E74|nr:xanthine dehydrogenase accessory protein XdhC [Maritimibacter sp. UBA3975]MAM63111.1 xanthine dehydrogenase accessory protein XdhC [Maritimibacter sp.]|tara:strand:- start:6658 stop:7632 length:975 start_codon:yes stop_codon:yes gene_type:complete
MSFDRSALAARIAAHGPMVRVVVAEVAGSAPREVGASITVWEDGQDGTIGGGTLEYEAAATAREMLRAGTDKITRSVALGPDMGQCCGGRVRLLWERFSEATLPDGPIHARPTGKAEPTLTVQRILARSRDRGDQPGPMLMDGWMIEPLTARPAPVWIWGAGHVGRALVSALSALPDITITWIDTAPERFPDDIPEGITALPAPDIAAATRFAPPDAHHIVLTYSHALDQAICDGLLARGFASAGVIGSATKWARFRKRLQQSGHTCAEIDRIRCPIGDKSLGKHPAAIALGVAADIVKNVGRARRDARPGDKGTENDRRLSGD